MLPENVFRDRNYSSQAITTIITTNYIVFALAVQMCVSCTSINWLLWIILAGLAWYNYYSIRRNPDEFGEKKIKIIYIVSLAGLAIMYYLIAILGQHCNVKPL
jgi:uncharacterized membrane protein YbhN (UPF0104 family)